MRMNLATILSLASSVAAAAETPIDRHALVTRHHIEWIAEFPRPPPPFPGKNRCGIRVCIFADPFFRALTP